jgi:putative endonuclease
MSRIELGRLGETLAEKHLEGLGYSIIARNHRCALGELDLIGRDGSCWVFVEVKTRRSLRCGTGAEAVTPQKQARLVRLGQLYLSQHAHGAEAYRFDVIDVRLPPDKPPEIRHIKGAFGGQ